MWLSIVALIGWIAALSGWAWWRKQSLEWNEALETEQRKCEELNSFLGGFSELLKHHKASGAAMSGVARRVADRVDAESVCIYELRDGAFEAVGVAGSYPLFENSNRYILTKPAYILETLKRERFVPGVGVLGEIADNREPELILDAAGDPRFDIYPDHEQLGSIMVTPLMRDAEVIGLLVAATAGRWAARFEQTQYAMLQNISEQVSLALMMVLSYDEISRQERLDQELMFARQIQSSLLPESHPEWGEFSVEAFTRSAKEVNGDFYDFVEIDDDRLLVVIGDACGKGVPACMLTAMTRSFIRAAVRHFSDLSSFLREINRNLYSDTDADRFVSVGCCLIDRKLGLLEFARAGHTELLTFVNGHIRRINPDGTALGMLPDELIGYDTICMKTQPGTSYLLYSDGINEALSHEGEEFGIDRLIECFQDSRMRHDTLGETIETIVHQVETFACEQHDDQTLILIRTRDKEPAAHV